MRKRDIARRIHQQAGVSDTQAAKLLDQILALLKTTLQKGDPIVIAGFGKFTLRNKSSRTGHNFQTGGALTISPRRVVSFRPSLVLKTEVNSSRQHGKTPRMREI